MVRMWIKAGERKYCLEGKMPMSVQQDINSFFGWVTDQREKIDNYDLPHHRRILLLSLLDTLARCAFPKHSNKKRFVCLIDCYSGWEHKDYVSLPQLRYLLHKTNECQDLKAEVESRIRKWPKHRILRPDEADPLMGELDQFRQGKCGQSNIEKARYASLLWKMRNFAVHEFRTPGQGMPLSNDNSTPYYHGCSVMGFQPDSGKPYILPESHSWELYIPPEVVSSLVLSCSDNLKRDFKQKGRNPYDSFNFGSSWFSNE